MNSDPSPLSGSDGASDDHPDESSSESPAVECWRCGNFFEEVAPHCPFCRARNKSPAAREANPPSPGKLRSHRKRSPLVATLIGYCMLLATSVGMFLAMLAAQDKLAAADDWELLKWMIVVELIDAAIIAWFLIRIGRPPAGTPIPNSRRVAAWIFGLAGLAVVFGLNMGYHALLRAFLQVQPDQLVGTPITRENIWAVIFAICIQPAVVEETFFRYLTFGWLRTAMGVHTAVWVTAIMFGILHVFVAMSIPMLIVVGAYLGYLRVWSGGIALPIVAHLLHNAAVIAIEGQF